MNTKLLNRHLEEYKKLMDTEKSKEEYKERKAKVDYYKSWTREKILQMSITDFEEYISKMWAMLIWGNKKYKINQIIDSNGFEKVKKELSELIWGKGGIDQRWDKFKTEINGFGPAMISELLCLTHPDKYMLWNRRAYVALNYLEVKRLPKYDYQLDGKKYKELCQVTIDIGEKMVDIGFADVDLLLVDYFIWEELQVEKYLSRIHKTGVQPIKETSLNEEAKESKSIHDDIKEKLAEIGQWLGFSTSMEKKIAEGAVVDTIWEAIIGNMGRVIYVFEVQTAGSIDSLLMNLLKSLNNPAVQGVVAVSDDRQLEKISKQAASIQGLRDKLKVWNYKEVLENHEALSLVNESINKLKLVPQGF